MQYTAAIQDVITQIPTAPDFVITRAFNRTTRRFCDATTAFRFKQELVQSGDDATITLTPPDQTVIASVHFIKWGSKKLSPVTDKYLAAIGENRLIGRPDYYVWREGNDITLYPTPQHGEDVTVEVSVRPSFGATEIPDWFAEKYYETLIAGTCAEMSRTPDTEFYNPELFKVMEAYFNAGVIDAKKEAYGADRSVPRRVRYGGY
jgi:hypothetical protein